MVHFIDKDVIITEIEKRRKEWWFGSSIEAKYKKEECDDILSFLDTLEVKEMDLMMHTIIAEGCDWLALHTKLNHNEIEDCRNLMLTIKDEQLKAQKGE